MRKYPRQIKSRNDALLGPGHIGNHSQPDLQGAMDRINRHEPARNANTVRKEYGGSV